MVAAHFLYTSRAAARNLTALLLLIAPFAFHAFAPVSPVWSSKIKPLTPQTWSSSPLFMSLSESSEPASGTDVTTSKRRQQQGLSKNPTPVLFSALQTLGDKIHNNIRSPTTALASAALAVALLTSPLTADAAMSGGRMGGSFGSSSSSRQSYSRPAPSRSSYGGGGGYGGGGSSYYSRPSITVAPIIGGGYNPYYASPLVNPFYAPRPMVYGGGVGAIAVNRGPSLLDLLLVGGIGYVAWSAFSNRGSDSDSSSSEPWADNASSVLGSGTSVVQLTVAVDVSNRDDNNSILSVLERLSQTSKTDSRVGIQNLTSQVALELLRRKSSIVSGYSRSKHFRDANGAQREFNSMSVKERSKFEAESTSKYGGVDYSSRSQRSVGGVASSQATVAVITLNLAIDGDSTKIPTIKSIQDVEDALRKIAADVKVDDCLQSAEILWTPEDRTETLTIKDVVADYPELRSV